MGNRIRGNKVLKENTLFGTRDKVKISIDRLKAFEPPEGYYGAFSGGKDSQTVYHLSEEAGVRVDWHYNLTTVDPPELVKFIKTNYPDVAIDKSDTTMWKLIEENRMPPTRIVRYCCAELKEGGGAGRFVITGVRWAESSRRKNTREIVEFDVYGSQSKKALNQREIFKMSDNDNKRMMLENCTIKGKHILNPIVDWEDDEVWEYIKSRNIKYCSLYDEGFPRLGCIGCPMAKQSRRVSEFERWPKYKQNYLRAFQRMINKNIKDGNDRFINETPEDVMEWWIYGTVNDKHIDGQTDIFDEGE